MSKQHSAKKERKDMAGLLKAVSGHAQNGFKSTRSPIKESTPGVNGSNKCGALILTRN